METGRAKVKARGKKGDGSKDEDRKGKGKGKANAKTTKYFDGCCLHCKAWGHMKQDCWWNESIKPGREASSLEASTAPVASTTREPPITGMLFSPTTQRFGKTEGVSAGSVGHHATNFAGCRMCCALGRVNTMEQPGLQ